MPDKMTTYQEKLKGNAPKRKVRKDGMADTPSTAGMKATMHPTRRHNRNKT